MCFVVTPVVANLDVQLQEDATPYEFFDVFSGKRADFFQRLAAFPNEDPFL